jgi:uncharacterized protein (TIGR02757 family)
MKKLGSLLEKVLREFPPKDRIEDDPIFFTRSFYAQNRDLEEIEALALFSAMLSYGSAKQFMKKIQATLELCDYNFLALIKKEGLYKKEPIFPNYRLSSSQEIAALAYAIGDLLKSEKSLETVFLKGYLPDFSIKNGLISLRSALLDKIILKNIQLTRGLLHLLPDPSKGGCAKRWHMFLRWVVRGDDKVDLGIWKQVRTQDLLIPLDTHISRIARNLGLCTSKVDNWKTAEEITQSLKQIDAQDPIRFDFALCHLGISGKCTHGKTKEPCMSCTLAPCCIIPKSFN